MCVIISAVFISARLWLLFLPASGAGIEVSRQSGRGQPGSGMSPCPAALSWPGQREQQGSRGRDVTSVSGHQEILTWSSSTHQSCWGGLAVGHTGHACLISGSEQVSPLVPGEQLMLAQLLLLGTFSWTSPRPWTAESSALPPAPAAAAVPCGACTLWQRPLTFHGTI